jgi:hypothetical protein
VSDVTNSNSRSQKVAEVRVAMEIGRVLDAGEALALSIIRGLVVPLGLQLGPMMGLESGWVLRVVVWVLGFRDVVSRQVYLLYSLNALNYVVYMLIK